MNQVKRAASKRVLRQELDLGLYSPEQIRLMTNIHTAGKPSKNMVRRIQFIGEVISDFKMPVDDPKAVWARWGRRAKSPAPIPFLSGKGMVRIQRAISREMKGLTKNIS